MELKDEIVRRGKVYYAKLARGKAMFLAPRMIPYFHAIWGVRRAEEPRRLSGRAGDPAGAPARMGDGHGGPARRVGRDRPRGVHAGAGRTAGGDARGAERGRLSAEVHLHLDARRRAVSRGAAPARDARTAVREIARAFSTGAGMTIPGELARVTGLSRPDAGRGNRALVAERVRDDARARRLSSNGAAASPARITSHETAVPIFRR